MKNYKQNKLGQEEMIGFALIIILVSVILLVFLAFSLSKPKTEAIESYEVNSFLQSTLQYTAACQTSRGLNSIQDLVFECDLKEKCSNDEDTCKILNETLTDILKESWPTGEDRPNKGYELSIKTEKTEEKKSVWKIIGTIAGNTVLIILIVVGALIAFSMLPIKNNYQVLTVMSGSMEPTIPTGSVIVIKPATEYKVDDIITFKTPGSNKKKDFTTHRIKEIKEESPVYRAVSVCAEVFGVTPEEYVEKVMAKLNTHQVILKSARDAVHKRQDYERFEKFQEVMNNVRNGTKLPLGISLTEKAKEKGIPNIIVTSTYHHSDEFEAVRELVPHYYDQVIGEGDQKRKNWEAGIEHVLRLERNK